MAKKKVSNLPSPTERSYIALQPLLADPSPRPLFTSHKDHPGIFGKAQDDQAAATHCLDHGWLKDSGTTVTIGKAKSARVERLWTITETGVKALIEKLNEPPQVLTEILYALERYAGLLRDQASILQRVEQMVAQQKLTVEAFKDKHKPPSIPTVQPSKMETNGINHSRDWSAEVLAFLDRYHKRNPTVDCPLPDLFDELSKDRQLSIGEFHDGLRELAKKGAINLKPFTRPGHELKRGELALIADQEIKFYAQCRHDRHE